MKWIRNIIVLHCSIGLAFAQYSALDSQFVSANPPVDSILADSMGSQSDKLEIVPDSILVSTKKSPKEQVEVSFRSTAIAIIAWPFEKILQPTFNVLFYPIRPPFDYIAKNKLFDKGMDLITLGDEKQIMLYPTFNLLPGTGSSVGITYRHWGLLLDQRRDYWYHIYSKYVNGDWDYRTKYSFRNLWDTQVGAFATFRYKEDRDNSFAVSEFDNKSYQFADSSWDARVGIGHPLFGNWSLGYSWGIDRRNFDEPVDDVRILPVQGDSLLIFDRFARGMYQKYWQYPLGIHLTYDSRDFSGSPTKGFYGMFEWYYVNVSEYKSSNDESQIITGLNHDFMSVNVLLQKYLLIGKKQYRLSKDESRKNQNYLENMSLSRTIKLLSPEQIRETLLERKVLAFQFRVQQQIEIDKGGAPFQSFQLLNANTPLRGYTTAFYGPNLYSLSMEYRWPIVELVDGVIFNEYGLVGKSWSSPEFENLKNSWGFGVRISKPNQFLTRVQLGFHGLSGMSIIMTINPEFR